MDNYISNPFITLPKWITIYPTSPIAIPRAFAFGCLKKILILPFKNLLYLFYNSILQLTLHPNSYFSNHNQYYSFFLLLFFTLTFSLSLSLHPHIKLATTSFSLPHHHCNYHHTKATITIIHHRTLTKTHNPQPLYHHDPQPCHY